MTKKLSTRSREVAERIRDREAFETYGALSGTRQHGYAQSGRLTGTDLEAFNRDNGSITYVVWSYATPIAWVTDDSRIHKVAQKFSVTTSKHQGKLYLLGD
jgi:hypothetical protein